VTRFDNAPAWPSRPYRGLLPYTFADAPLFAGRQTEIRECAEALFASDKTVFLLHGHSGCGKSSFLQAGLLPHLREIATLSKSGVERGARVTMVPSGNDLVMHLGRLPYEDVCRATYRIITSLQRSRHASRLRLEKALLGARSSAEFLDITRKRETKLFRALEQLSLAQDKKLVVAIDQAENVFSRAATDVDDRRRYFGLLAHLTLTPIDLKLLISLRSEFKANFDDALQAARADFIRIGTYYLDTMTRKGMKEAVCHPTSREPHVLSGYTLPPPITVYRFDFEPALPALIIDDLYASTGDDPRLLLPLLQVICERLYAELGARRERSGESVIGRASYWETGSASTQIASHVEDVIVNFFQHDQRPRSVNCADQVDRWRMVLCDILTQTTNDVAIAKGSVTEKELLTRARQYGCKEPVRMIQWLGQKENYILQRTGPTKSTHSAWKLVHDQLAAALVWWRRTEHVERAAHIRFRSDWISATERFLKSDLYPDTPPPERRFITLNDLIWDHQIPLYAYARGFAQRLGFKFITEPAFDLTSKHRTELKYGDFVKPARRRRLPRLVVLPERVFPELREPPWCVVGIPNTYRGFAVVGRPRGDLQPVGERVPISDTVRRERLVRLASAMCDSRTRTIAFEGPSRQFAELLLNVAGIEDVPAGLQLANGHFRNEARDRMFTFLVNGEAQFALGPAPSRALAEQAGFVVFADYDDLFFLAPDDIRRKLRALTLHEVWAVDIDPNERPTLLRLLSLLFYTVEHIRARPDDFVQFLYNQQLAAGAHGADAYRLQRQFIRSAITTCYSYATPDQYAFEYLSPQPQSYEYRAGNCGPLVLFSELAEWRARCDQALSALGSKERLPRRLERVFFAARRQYEIFNYFDAHALLSQLLQEVA
jgi:hypothetical protein